MKVVLLDNIRGVGRVGDVKDVSDGYAKNFLLPHGKAKAATQGAVRDAASLQAKKLESSALAKVEAEALAGRINGTTVALTAKASAKGKLFAGIEATHIAEAISKAVGARISPSAVRLPEHIKTTGDHPVTLDLAEGVTADIIVTIHKTP